MNLNSAFLELLRLNEPNRIEVLSSVDSLVRKLDSVYYDDDGQIHYIISGSFGRGTATKSSDVDVCYILPSNDYQRFCNRKGNIQSQLLSEVRIHIQNRYPNSTIRGDGQVVDALFKKTIIELVPSFKTNIYSTDLTYPNSHDDGSWLKTNPTKQQEIINDFSTQYPIFKPMCKLIRCWRDENNVHLKGIEIDLLVYDFLNNNFEYRGVLESKVSFVSCLVSFFKYLQAVPVRSLFVFGDNDLKIIELEPLFKMFSKVEKRLFEVNMATLWDNCINLFGMGFPQNPYYSKSNKPNEQFIQDLFQVRIKYKLLINCNISADGFMVKKLKELLKAVTPTNRFIVQRSKSLDFYIEECNVPEPYDIYWKVRNVGEEARKRDDIRGTIIKGENKHHENSKFHGPHYVECYIVKENLCVARARIDVPIE